MVGYILVMVSVLERDKGKNSTNLIHHLRWGSSGSPPPLGSRGPACTRADCCSGVACSLGRTGPGARQFPAPAPNLRTETGEGWDLQTQFLSGLIPSSPHYLRRDGRCGRGHRFPPLPHPPRRRGGLSRSRSYQARCCCLGR